MINTSRIKFSDNIIQAYGTPLKDTESLGHEFFYAMQKYKENTAQYIVDTGEQTTYADLLQNCIRTSLKIQDNGFTSNVILSACTFNHKYSCVPWFAGLFLGMKICYLDPSLTRNDTVVLLKKMQPKLLFVVPEAVELIEESLKESNVSCHLVVFGESEKYEMFSEYLQPHPEECRFKPHPVASNRETAIILCSSGTTGLPKGICQSHYSIFVQTHVLVKGLQCAFLNYATLYWISGVVVVARAVFNGVASVVCRRFNPIQFWSLLEQYKVSFAVLSPSGALALLKIGRPDGINTTNLLTLTIGGGAVSAINLMLLSDILPGTFVSQAYGQSEAGVLTQFNRYLVKDNILLLKNPQSCGRPLPGVSLKVVDLESGQTLGPNQNGELLVKCPSIMNGYYGDDSSAHTFDADGWMRTGDVVYYDEDFCFYIVDRIKEMLKYQSWHVAPASVELIIDEHPAVAQSVVIGIPHEEDGDHLLAAIKLRDHLKNEITPTEMETYINDRVEDRQKIRAGVIFVDDFPMTPSGKIRRFALRDIIMKTHFSKYNTCN